MVLKDSVRDRVAFNFNKTRELRSDVTMLVYDMIHNKNNPAHGGDSFIDAIVHNALGLPGIVKTPLLQLEVQVFGELDMVKDVEKVHVPHTGFRPNGVAALPDGARTHLTAFFGNQGVPVNTWNMSAVPVDIPPGSDALKLSVKNKAALL
jgi:hypothetical protein